MVPVSSARRAISNGEIALRDSVFPGAESRLWDKTRDQGFITIPKTMPYIIRILDDMSPKGQPLGAIYQMLWTYTWNNNGFVRLGNLSELAFAAGFRGERGERTMRERLRKLADLGFIELQAHASNPTGFAFIPNPHEVIVRIHHERQKAIPSEQAKLPALREDTYNAFLARAVDIKAIDVPRIQRKLLEPPASTAPTKKTLSVKLKPRRKTGA